MSRTWEAWYPDAGSTGLLVARARIGLADEVWLHAAPARLAVTVREGDPRDEAVIAHAEPLERVGTGIRREDRWPSDADLGAVVILPGGEAGTLRAWWNAEDGSEWRWSVELSNHR